MRPNLSSIYSLAFTRFLIDIGMSYLYVETKLKASIVAAKTSGKPLGIAVEPKTATQDTVTVMLKN